MIRPLKLNLPCIRARYKSKQVSQELCLRGQFSRTNLEYTSIHVAINTSVLRLKPASQISYASRLFQWPVATAEAYPRSSLDKLQFQFPESIAMICDGLRNRQKHSLTYDRERRALTAVEYLGRKRLKSRAIIDAKNEKLLLT